MPAHQNAEYAAGHAPAPGTRRGPGTGSSAPGKKSLRWSCRCGILAAHFADQRSHVFRDCRSAQPAMTDSPCPEQPKALAVPGNAGFGLNDVQCRSRTRSWCRSARFSQMESRSGFESRRHGGCQLVKCAERQTEGLTRAGKFRLLMQFDIYDRHN